MTLRAYSSLHASIQKTLADALKHDVISKNLVFIIENHMLLSVLRNYIGHIPSRSGIPEAVMREIFNRKMNQPVNHELLLGNSNGA